MRAWAAVATLSLGVLFAGGDMARATPGLKFSYVSARAINKVIDDPKVMHDLKGCESLMPEGVNVVDASPKIRHFVSVPEDRPIRPIVRNFRKIHSYGRRAVRANHVRPLHMALIRELQNFSAFQFSPKTLFEGNDHTISGSLPRVSKVDNRLPRSNIARRFCEFNARKMDVGTQLPFRRIIHHTNGYNEGRELQKSNKTGDDSNLIAQPPSLKPIIWLFGVGGSGFMLCLTGVLCNWRRGARIVLLSIGFLLGACGFAVFSIPGIW